ncbi:MAG: penicillin-binding transpeptidase domain-containing protein, partial [Pseudomonadota bacterium]|nr:penicillin-binding transpeptidase domain-containing protein [Pseudomonadota bacterium]
MTNIDNKGISGLEKYIDDQGLADLQILGMATANDLAPITLSIDLRVQHVARDEALQAKKRFRAKAAGAVVINAKSGEVVAMTSVPDFDPEYPIEALRPDKLNRMSAGLYEMGSTIKSFTTAMALDSGMVTLDSTFDAR